jgi:MFS family permease
MLFAFLPIFLKEQGLEQFQISLLICVLPLSSLILLPAFGILSDKTSPKNLILLGLALFGLHIWILRLFFESKFMFLIIFLGGIGADLFAISCISLYFKSIGEEHKGRKLGLFNALFNLGFGIGPLLGGYFLIKFTKSEFFIFDFLLLLPFAFLSLFLKKIEPTPFRIKEYKEDIFKKEVIFFILAFFLFAFHFGVETVCFSLFMKENLSFGTNVIGLTFFITCLFLSITSLLSGLVSEKMKTYEILMPIGLVMSGIFNILIIVVDSFPALITIRFFHIIGDGMFLLGARLKTSSLFTSARIGAPVSIIRIVIICGVFCGALISGLFPNFLYPFVFAGILSIMGSIAMKGVPKDSERTTFKYYMNANH